MPSPLHVPTLFRDLGDAGGLAHLVQTGFGGFYDGLVHWAVTPEDVMLVLGLSFLAALGGRERARQLVFVLPAAWFVGGAAGLLAPTLAPPALATTLSFGLVGLLVALDRRLPAPLFLLLMLAAAGLHGAANGSAMATAGLGWLGLTGASLAVFVVVSVLPALIVGLTRPAARVAVRVGGSWLAAAALLMLGWMFRQS